MALFNRVTTWVSNQVLTASALNGEFNNILNNAQASSWIGYSANVGQMQTQVSPGGVGTESLAGSVADELARVRFMLAYTLGKTYWYDQTGANLGTGGIPTASLANGAVTQVKRAALTFGVSSASGSFSTASGTPVDVTNLSVSITTTGRQVMLMLIGNGALNSLVEIDNTAGIAASGLLYFLSGSTVLTQQFVGHSVGGTTVNVFYSPVSAFQYIDQPVAGTYTYKVQVALISGTSFKVTNARLVAYEL